MKYCTTCKDKYADKIIYCPICGEQVDMYSEEVMIKDKKSKKCNKLIVISSIIVVFAIFLTSGIILSQKIQLRHSSAEDIIMNDLANNYNALIHTEYDKSKKYHFVTTNDNEINNFSMEFVKYYKKFSSGTMKTKNTVVFYISCDKYIGEITENNLTFAMYDRYGNYYDIEYYINYSQDIYSDEVFIAYKPVRKNIKDCKFVVVSGLSEEHNDGHDSVIFKIE